MFNKLTESLKKEETQRAILQGTGTIVVFIATNVFATYASKGMALGIDKLMEKIHSTNETQS
jgi:hypothetical protein